MNTLDIAVAALAADGLAWPALIAAGKLRAGQCGCGSLAAGVTSPRPNRPATPVSAAEAALLGSGEAMTRRHAAELLKVGEREIRALGKSGVLKEIPQGGRSTLVTAASVDRLLAARLAPGTPAEVA